MIRKATVILLSAVLFTAAACGGGGDAPEAPRRRGLPPVPGARRSRVEMLDAGRGARLWRRWRLRRGQLPLPRQRRRLVGQRVAARGCAACGLLLLWMTVCHVLHGW